MKRAAARFACIVIWSSAFAMTMFASAVLGASPAERVDRQTKAALAMDAHPERGSKVFDQYCAKCHGPGALGNAKRGIPALAGQRLAYLVRQLANFANAERDSSTMHAVVSRGELQNPQVWTDIAAYLNGIPSRLPLSTGAGQDVALGRGIFHEQCASCHGSDASGDADGFAPSLRHQHYVYLNAQMHKLAEGYRHNADEELVRFLRSLDDRDMIATADYLSRLTGAGKDRKRMRDDGVVVD
jgi:cytochrome c553